MNNLTWKDAVLKIVRNRHGEEITLREIYKEILAFPIVTESHKELWKPGKQPRYQCWVRKMLSALTQEGLIIRPRKAVYKSN